MPSISYHLICGKRLFSQWYSTYITTLSLSSLVLMYGRPASRSITTSAVSLVMYTVGSLMPG